MSNVKTGPVQLSGDEKIDQRDNPSIEELKLGLWNMKIENAPNNTSRLVQDIISSYPTFKRLAQDIYCLDPPLFLLVVLGQLFGGIQDALLMYFSSSLLKTVRRFISHGEMCQ